jgi:hypothetical protein
MTELGVLNRGKSNIKKHRGKRKKLEVQWAEPVSLTCHFILRKVSTKPSIDGSYKISINLVKWF